MKNSAKLILLHHKSQLHDSSMLDTALSFVCRTFAIAYAWGRKAQPWIPSQLISVISLSPSAMQGGSYSSTCRIFALHIYGSPVMSPLVHPVVPTLHLPTTIRVPRNLQSSAVLGSSSLKRAGPDDRATLYWWIYSNKTLFHIACNSKSLWPWFEKSFSLPKLELLWAGIKLRLNTNIFACPKTLTPLTRQSAACLELKANFSASAWNILWRQYCKSNNWRHCESNIAKLSSIKKQQFGKVQMWLCWTLTL